MKKPLYWLLFLIAFLLSLLPLRLLYILSDFISFIYMRVFSYRKSVIYINLSRSFPDMKYGEIRKIAREFQRNLTDIFIEAIWSMSKSAGRINKRVKISEESVKRVNEGLAKERGVLFIMGHQANWELLNAFYYMPEGEGFICSRNDLVSVYQRQSNGPVDMLMNYIRSRNGIKLVESGQIIRSMIKNRDENKIYFFIADQSPAQLSGEKFAVDFLHQKTWMIKGPEYVARRFDMPTYYLVMKRVERGRYEVDLKTITLSPSQTEEGYVTARYAELLQEGIEADKSGWLWSHRRWKL